MLTGFFQVYRSGSGFNFRISLPTGRFISEEVFESARDAAIQADLFKLLLVRRYKLTGKTMWPSLPAAEFSKALGEAGIDRSSDSDLFVSLSFSCKEFLLNGGNEALSEYCTNRVTMRKEIE